MASTADLVYQNFVWRIENLSPTDASLSKETRFKDLGGRVDASQSAGTTRGFRVAWAGSDEENQDNGEPVVHDLGTRVATHRYQLEVYYSKKLKWETLQRVILKDRHDLAKELQESDYWVGISPSSPSSEIGLKNRVRESDELDRDSDDEVWILRSVYRCYIWETE